MDIVANSTESLWMCCLVSFVFIFYVFLCVAFLYLFIAFCLEHVNFGLNLVSFDFVGYGMEPTQNRAKWPKVHD